MSKRMQNTAQRVSLEEVLSSSHDRLPDEARDAIRSRVVAHAASQGRMARAKVVFLRSAATFTATATLLAGTGYAAANSSPGDALYPMKRAAEEIRLVFSPSARQDEALLNMTRERTREVRELLESDAPQGDVDRAAQDFGEAAGRAVKSQETSEAAAEIVREIEQEVSSQPKAVQDVIGSQVPEAAPAPTPSPAPPSGATPSPSPNPQPAAPQGGTSAPEDAGPGSGSVTSPGR